MLPKSAVLHSNPEILGGTPVFAGTRVPVQTLFDYLEGGETLDEFLRQFPSNRGRQDASNRAGSPISADTGGGPARLAASRRPD